MKKITKLITLALSLLLAVCCQTTNKEQREEKFKFAYFTDIHLGFEEGSQDSLLKAAFKDVKNRGVDFVIFGGDNFAVDRCSKEDEEIVRASYKRLSSMIEEEGLKVYHTVGNHDRYFHYKGQPSTLGFELYQELVHPDLYYSMDYDGVQFIFLNGAELTDGGEYYRINEGQKEWLKSELEKIGTEKPVIVSIHVPLISLYHLAMEGKTSVYTTVINSKEIVDILEPYNLKVVLQGHNHIHEEILVRENWFVTGGATCGAWPSEVGYMLFDVDSQDDVKWNYIKF